MGFSKMLFIIGDCLVGSVCVRVLMGGIEVYRRFWFKSYRGYFKLV